MNGISHTTRHSDKMNTGIGSDAWMIAQGAVKLRLEESKTYKHLLTPCAIRKGRLGSRSIRQKINAVLSRMGLMLAAESDENKDALEQVRKITKFDHEDGGNLLESEEITQKLSDAKKRLSEPPRE